MPHPHRVTLHIATGENGKNIVVCKPSKLEDNRIKVGGTMRFEAADSGNTVEMGFSGDATFTPGQSGAFFQEFTAATTGKFEFAANLRLPDGTVIEWAPGAGGQGEVQF